MIKDTIYREDAIEAIRKARTSDVVSYQYADLFINALCRVPSADRPRGKWIFHSEWEEHYCRYECSLCGRTYDYDMNYCGFCGARMKGAGDD